GHDIALGALALLPPDFRLAIVGEGEERGRLEAQARALGLAERVHFSGAVSQLELPLWYSMADVLVLCSSREGLPNVVLEALACGTPVVATDVGGVAEVVATNRTGRLITKRSADALAAAVLELLESPPSRDEVCDSVGRFDWQATTRDQLALFRTIAARRRTE